MTGEITLAGRLRRELQPYPGRLNQVLRTVLAGVIVIIISLTLQVPFLAISLVGVFFVSQTNVVATRMIGVYFLAAITLAVSLSLLLFVVTWNTPALRLLIASLIFFIIMFLMRASRFGVVFSLSAVLFIYNQSLVDLSANAELVTRNVLWEWMAMSYAIVVTILVNTFFLPTEPVKQLKKALNAHFNDVICRLDATASHAGKQHTSSEAGRDLQTLYKLLRLSVMRDKNWRDNEKQHLALIAMLSQLHLLAYRLPDDMTAQADCDAVQKIKAACQVLLTSINNDGPLPDEIDVSFTSQNNVLMEMGQLINNFIHNEKNRISSPPDAKASFFTEDAFSNNYYPIFAFKTLFSALLCYFFYVMADWPGIHTIMLTCVIVAQPGLGSTWRKIVLRFIGALLGSVTALLSIIFLLPHFDTLFDILLLATVVLFIASWIATGSEAISYAGVQFLFTFSIAILEEFGPVYTLTEVRDRLFGIMAGIVIAGFVQALIYPEREGGTLKMKLVSLLDGLCKNLRQRDKKAGNITLSVALAGCEQLASRVALEPSWSNLEGDHAIIHQKIQELLLQIRCLIDLHQDIILAYSHSVDNLSNDQQQAYSMFIKQCAQQLEQVSHLLSVEKPKPSEIQKIDVPPALPQAFTGTLQAFAENVYQLRLIVKENNGLMMS